MQTGVCTPAKAPTSVSVLSVPPCLRVSIHSRRSLQRALGGLILDGIHELLGGGGGFGADLLDGAVGDLGERGVARVVMLHIRVVAGGVVAADEGPAGVGAGVGRGAVEQIGVEEEAGAGLHLAVD